MVNWDKKFAASPYDSAGMPLGAVTADMDVKEDVAKTTVHDVYEAPLPLFSDDDPVFQPELKRTKYNPALNNTAIQVEGHRIHKAHADDIGTGIVTQVHTVDLEDPAEARKAIVEDSVAKGIEVPKLPDVAKKDDVNQVLSGKTNTVDVTDSQKKDITEEVKVQRDTPKEQRANEDDDFLKKLDNV